MQSLIGSRRVSAAELLEMRALLARAARSRAHQGGGWRYRPGQPGDTSVVGWQVAALVAGKAAGLRVDPVVLHRVSKFLDGVDHGDGRYGYTAPGTGTSTTASGVLSRIRSGWPADDARLAPGIDFVLARGPGDDHYFDFFASGLLHEVGGERAADWRRRMRQPLLAAQVADGDHRGSWLTGVDGKHGTMLGRIGCTALAAIILEIPASPRTPQLL